jgi:hypothetical protein
MMINAHGAPALSLLDLLHSAGNEFHLRIRLTADEAADAQSGSHVFLVLDGPKSFTRIVAARIVTKAEHVVRDLFILQQSDDYPAANTEIWPLTNADLEARWQHAGKTYHALATQEPSHRSPLFLSGQIQPDGRLAAFHSLFYCTFTRTFFHPPCPLCGGHLWLCSDESLLQAFGLPLYSQSLSRYLYCPSCVPPSADARFYAFSRKNSDPDAVLDTKSLINQFGNLMGRDIEPRLKFPCTDCDERGTCYGVENLVDKRMVPYSFYPFFAFFFEADTLQAADFLMLLSGASLEALIERAAYHHWNGRLNALRAAQRRLRASTSSFFATPSDQKFLEILYLKLAFLEELMDCLRKVCSEEMNDGAFSINRVWVRLPEQTSYLPIFWSFNVHYLGFGADVNPSLSLSPNLPVNLLYFLGKVWFFALLTNSRQDMRAVRPILKRMLSEPNMHPADPGRPMFQNKDPIFAPENIFWDPPGQPISEPLHSLWENSLVLGMDLLSAAVNRKSSWSEMHFYRSLKKLREDVKDHHFRQASVEARAPVEDLRISAVLKSILLKWQKEETPATQATGPRDDSEKTILLTEVYSPGKAASVPGEEPIPETVHLRAAPPPTPAMTKEDRKKAEPAREPLPKSRPVQTVVPGGSGEKDEVVLETVILRSDPIEPMQNPKGIEPRPSSGTEIPKTVILSPGNASRMQNHAPASVPAASEEAAQRAQEQDPFQTKASAPTLQPKNGSVEKGLPETVIIRTQKKEP